MRRLAIGCIMLGLLPIAFTLAQSPKRSAKPKTTELQIGIEYAMPGPAKTFAQMGVPVVKFYPDEIPWGKMQKSADAPIDFSKLDRLVREYQDAGFRDCVIVLKSLSAWASKDAKGLMPKNLAPKPEYMPLYSKWVQAVVERYDHDGKDDMPGLKRPVRYYEVGSEFSSFEPEPIEDYLPMQTAAHKAAHAAFPGVMLMHCAFLPTTAFRDHPKPSEYDEAFGSAAKRATGRIFHKTLADMRAVLDHPETFDAVNFHALGDHLEIEEIVTWLRFEMKRRKYDKPLVISDTTPAPFIAWGQATRVTNRAETQGVAVLPATEADRPRLAEYFTKLIDGDKATTEWTHGFVAADMVKKIVVSAEQGILLIDTSFMEDLHPFKLKLAAAGAGTSAWAGMVDAKLNFLDQSRTVLGLRPSFYAIQQVQRLIRGYDSVERVRHENPRVRMSRFEIGSRSVFVAWLEPEKLVLPGEPESSAEISLKVSGGRWVAETMIHRSNQSDPDREMLTSNNGSLRLKLTPTPVFVHP